MQLFRDLTPLPKKFTVTSPYMLAKTLSDEHYRDLESWCWPWPTCCGAVRGSTPRSCRWTRRTSPAIPKTARSRPPAINRVLERRPAEKAVHLCYGNYGGQTIQKGRTKAAGVSQSPRAATTWCWRSPAGPQHELTCCRTCGPRLAWASA